MVETWQELDTSNWGLRVQSRSASPPTASMYELLSKATAQWPEHIAVSDSHGSLSYRQLEISSSRAAHWFTQAGITQGDRVAMIAEPTTRFVISLFGALALGATVVPVNPAAPTLARNKILMESGARMGIGDFSPVDQVETISWSDHESEAKAHAPVTADAKYIPRSGDVALIFFTSGSTGAPCGVVCTHAQVLFCVQAIQHSLRYRANDVVQCILPLSFDYGLYQVLLSLNCGAKVVLGDFRDNMDLVSRCRSSRATVLPLLPPLAQALVSMSKLRGSIPSLRLLTNTGERLPPSIQGEIVRALPGASVALMYGLTECKRVSIGVYPSKALPQEDAGRPIRGVEVRILNENEQLVKVGELGKIAIVGDNVSAGYWAKPTLTREKFRTASTTHQPVFLSGDWGRIDDDGRLYVLGRDDDQFKSRGVRVSTFEIEDAALSVVGVREALVELTDERKHATLWFAGDVDAAFVIDGLRAQLEQTKMPHEIRRVDTLPIQLNGKHQRLSLHNRNGRPVE